MAASTAESEGQIKDRTRGKDKDTGGEDAGPLESEGGTTTIADGVVSKVAGIAAREVPGVHDLGGGATRAIGGATRALGIGDERSQGVSVEVGEREAAVDLVVVVEYGESVPQVANHIRDNVTKRIEGITGLHVTEVNIAVNDLFFPGDEQPNQIEESRVA
ncbi:Asp23/Gls24 family envelope stress response protein [soil metagenome]